MKNPAFLLNLTSGSFRTVEDEQKWLGYLAIAYAFYIGVGVSVTIHWFSDFVAGAVIGTVVGAVLGTSFTRSQI
jgi:hypothetical protein